MTSRKVLNTARDMGQYMADYYYELDRIAKTGEKKIAWCTSVGPAELLRAMGFAVYFPETHSAMLGTSRMATDYIPYATALGYSPEVCSYMTADIGAFLQGVTPLSKAFKGIESIPRPDVVVFNTNQCRDVQDWFGWYAKRFNVPIIGISGNVGVKDVSEHLVSSVASQIEDLIEPLEGVSGTKFDIDRLREVVGLSRECSDMWKAVLEEAAAVPSPLTFFDGCTLMGPAVVGRGTQVAVDLYKKLLHELKEKIAKGEGALESERFRIYWDGMPVWGRLGAHSKLFAGLDANVLASTYCSSWIFTALDKTEPFMSMAKAYTDLFIVRSEEYKQDYIKEKIELYKVDALIYHDSKTCPNNTNCRYGLSKRIEDETGIPSLIIDGDLNDLRCISDEQTKTKVEAFIEQLEENEK
ncbi:MAG: 2-hydroxyacyl-CoA dehydratase [Deltaproteobacteria bacterium]|jgi:benzoyl-CoA reductase/2-hydroxyglutaryl-CoA dehydratase subunit BcrC/BadD/HgdB|nr:2-hydroxyacyl-CoA dehydratase [Deltaproteobacteria bacterium]MBT4644208.1 2-hydroxyacyl-CoA dehydratase [Deltaproteobacteria bacterium]MBT6500472.1 2-hydroxyacyl-CoA dehydratase [Deltaproteobacteria bacterium]MBT6611462.1 2-hydroxyacyl-CoA dehydratase [Deltaproteobacteria bacterium]MBT7154721.1 2-hydroxyacyl-CoA dehydratase [Deltaproteobacteria bacterium]